MDIRWVAASLAAAECARVQLSGTPRFCDKNPGFSDILQALYCWSESAASQVAL
jgi:hypothetical protein